MKRLFTTISLFAIFFTATAHATPDQKLIDLAAGIGFDCRDLQKEITATDGQSYSKRRAITHLRQMNVDAVYLTNLLESDTSADLFETRLVAEDLQAQFLIFSRHFRVLSRDATIRNNLLLQRRYRLLRGKIYLLLQETTEHDPL